MLSNRCSCVLLINAREAGADRIELYTEKYASEYDENREKAIAPYREAAVYANEIGIGINAGHDLSLKNLKYFKESSNHFKIK